MKLGEWWELVTNDDGIWVEANNGQQVPNRFCGQPSASQVPASERRCSGVDQKLEENIGWPKKGPG